MATARLQGWFKELVVSQGAMPHKLQRAAQMYQLNEHDVVAATRDVSIYARIHVYTSGYVMRLLECIHADFPFLRQFMGGEAFDKFARASLHWSPSTSYSLYDLGSTFIRFLEATRPPMAPGQEYDVYLDLPVEIARAERARQEALRAPGIEGDETLADVTPEEVLFAAHTLQICTPACVRLLDMKFPLKDLFTAMNREEDYELPPAQQTYAAVSRMNYRLHLEELQPWQYHLLQSAAEPVMLFAAVQQAAMLSGVEPSTVMADVCIWLPLFSQYGLLGVRRC